MLGPEGQSKDYQLIARILEASLNQPLKATHLTIRARADFMEVQHCVDYLCSMGLLESMELFGSRSFGRTTRIYWTSRKGKELLAHLEAMSEIAGMELAPQ